MNEVAFKKTEYYYLRFIFFLRYFADAMFYSFTALYLSSIGLKEGLIGTIQSISTITVLCVNPIWSIFAKNNKRSRILLFVLSIIEGILIIIYGNLDIVPALMVLTSLLACASGPYYSIMDGYAANYCANTSKDYSSFRVMGSIAYLFGVPLAGTILGFFNYNVLFLISGILFIMCGIFSSFLKKTEAVKENKKRDFNKILKNKALIFYTIAYLFIVILSQLGDNYLSLFFTNEKGLTAQEYSYINTAILICEALSLLFFGKILNKAKTLNVILFFGILCFIRYMLLSFVNLDLWILIPIVMLRGVGWGAFLFFHIRHITKLVGIENVTTAGILIIIVSSLFQFIMNNVLGYCIEGFGYSIIFKFIAIITLISTLIYIIYCKSASKNE